MLRQVPDFSVRATTGAFDLDQVEANLNHVAALADEEKERREALEQELEHLRRENEGLRPFAALGRRQYEALQNRTAGRIQVLLEARPDDARLVSLERQVREGGLDFDELARLFARLSDEVREGFATRPEAEATALPEISAGSRIDWSEYRVH